MLLPRVVLAHRSELLRTMLRVAGSGAIHVVGETWSAVELGAVCALEAPDAALVGDGLDDRLLDAVIDGMVAGGVGVVVLGDDAHPGRVTSLLERGVSGYLVPDSSPEQVVEALVAVAGGAAALHPAAAVTILNQWRRLRTEPSAPGAALTVREGHVLAAMVEGMAAKAIARDLGMALKTVENHKIRIYDKLGVRSQAQAVSVAVEHGLVPQPVGTGG
ncbi:MAG: LuxR C-terminal-related transcriptional regulator [Actinomycetota bacterium]